MPSQVGYHSDGQQQPLAISYPSPTLAAPVAVDTEKTTPNISRQKRKYRRQIKSEPPEVEESQPKLETNSDVDDSKIKSPAQAFEPSVPIKVEPTDGIEFRSPGEEPVRKKVKVMIPNLDSPRGLRTLLPGKILSLYKSYFPANSFLVSPMTNQGIKVHLRHLLKECFRLV